MKDVSTGQEGRAPHFPEVVRAETGAAPHTTEYAWVRKLRSNCEMLCRVPPDLVTAIGVATCLERGTPGEARALCELCQRLAEEFGFTVSVQIREMSVSVRFARREAARREAGGERREGDGGAAAHAWQLPPATSGERDVA